MKFALFIALFLALWIGAWILHIAITGSVKNVLLGGNAIGQLEAKTPSEDDAVA